MFLDAIRETVDVEAPRAAYIGASNGDQTDFYLLFLAAMEGIGVEDCRMISSSFPPSDAAFLNEADVILLAGGSVRRGWDVLEESGMKESIVRRYYEGALLMGVSAGAVQLGLGGWDEGDSDDEPLIETFRLIPFIISAHEEKEEWVRLTRAIELAGPETQGIGIPAGGGMIYHADHSIEPVRYPLHQFSTEEGRVVRSLLFPAPVEDVIDASAVH